MKIKDAKVVRETLYKIIFSSLFIDQQNEKENPFLMWQTENLQLTFNLSGIEDYLKEEDINDECKMLILSYLKKYTDDKNQFSDNIKKYLKEGFSLERLSKTDLSIIFVAMLELKYNPELNERIIINEAVEIAKKYSNQNSYKFINGILRSLVKEMRNE